MGVQCVDVFVLNKLGKIAYKVNVELLLEAISNDLTIVNVKWLPGSQSQLAVGTKDFIKIYDLAEDAMSPTHNVMIFNGFISDFTFSTYSVTDQGRALVTMFASSKSGAVYHHEITYTLSSFDKKKSKEED